MELDPNDDSEGSASDELTDVIRFWLRHDYRSLKSIAEACSVGNGNLHGALSGRRKFSLESRCRVANALGINVDYDGLNLTLSVVPNTVHFLLVSQQELPELEILNRVGFIRGTVSVIRAESPREEKIPGTFVFLRTGSRTVAIYCNDSNESVGEVIAQQIAQVVGGVSVGVYSPTPAQWLCWKCRKADPTDFDAAFGDRKRATIAEWASMIIHVDALGLCPDDLRHVCFGQASQKSSVSKSSNNENEI